MGVDLGVGKAMTPTEPEEASLEGAARELAHLVRDAAQREAPELGLANGSANVVDRGRTAKVFDRAGRGGHRDAVAEGRLRIGQ